MTMIELDGLFLPPTLTGGTGWFHNDLTGWYTLTSDKAPVNERSQRHGAFASGRSYRSAAAISFNAVFVASSELELLQGQQTIGAIGSDDPVVMRVTDGLEATERIVSVRATDIPDHHGRVVNNFAVDCLARDPRRYSINDPWVTARPPSAGSGLVWSARWPAVWGNVGGTTGRISLINRGTKSSSPVMRVYGGLDSFSLINIDLQRRVSFSRVIPVGSYVEVDFARRRATLDGDSDVSRYFTSREWWDVGPGVESVTQLEVTGAFGDPYLAGLVRSAW